MGRSLISLSGILLLGLGVIFVNGLASRLFSGAYVDLTSERLYTLSAGTKQVLEKLSDPVTIKVYISRTDAAKYPAIKLYGDRVESLLREYRRYAPQKLTLDVFDPRPDSEEESWAQKYGLTPLEMPSGEKLFFGLAAVNSRGDEEVIPVFSLARQEYLEYDITRVVSSLGTSEKPVIGLLSSIKIEGMNIPQMVAGRVPHSDPWVLMSQLQKLADVRVLPGDVAQIDSKVKLLMVVHPKALPPQTLFAIDQFVLRGGNLFVAEDPYCNAEPPDQQNPAGGGDKASSLNSLLSGWGAELTEKKVVGDARYATNVRTSEDAPPSEFPLWVTLDGQDEASDTALNRKDVATAQLQQILLPWPGELQKKDVPGVTFTPLLQSSPDSMLFGEEDYRYGGGDPALLREKLVRGGGQRVFAARLDGKFKSNFKEAPAGAPPPTAEHPLLAESVEQSHVLVVADVDFLADYASVVAQNYLGAKMVSLLNDNLRFAGNAVENLLGSNDLISLRSRGQFTRPFTRVHQIEQAAEDKWHNEELTLQASLSAANQRLSQLQAGTDKGEGQEQTLSSAVLDEVKRFREQRAEAQRRLREVRRNLRQDKERLGQGLFLLNTFFVPTVLVLGVLWWGVRRRTGARSRA